jgi:small-conductance mechanosensitive channel
MRNGPAFRDMLGPMKHRIFFALLLVLWPLIPAARADETAQTNRPAVEAQGIETAPVVLDGMTLFRVRGVSAYPAGERASAISGRIRAFAQETTVPLDALRVVDAKDRTNIVAADRPIISVLDADAELEHVDRHVLAEIYQTKITGAVKSYRQVRTPRALLIGTGYALAATALLAVVLIGVLRLFRRAGDAIERRYKARLQNLKIQSFEIMRAEQLLAGVETLLRTARAVIVLVLVYFYLQFVLGLYPWTRPFSRELLAMTLRPLAVMGVGLVQSVPDLIFLAILIVVVRYLLRMGRLFFDAVERRTVKISNFDPSWADPTYRVVRLLVIAFAVVVAYPYIPGSNSAAFKGVSIFLGVMFSLGSSAVIANFVAGYTLIYRRAFKVGDRIRIDDRIGDVLQMRAQVTRLRSLKNEEIILPNSMILNSHVVNYSSLARERGLILHTTVGIGYETPWRQVEAMLLEAAGRTEGLLKQPAPFVLQKSLDDFCVTYELNGSSDQPQRMMELYTALHRNILDVFNEYGVQIMTPAYRSDPAQPKVVPREQWFTPPARPPAGGGGA